MAKGVGRRIQLGVAKESVRGTPESAPTYWVDTISLSKDEKPEKEVYEQANGTVESSTGAVVVAKKCEGNFEAYADDKILPLFLYNLLGTLNSALKGGETAVYDHTITVAQTAQHQALSIFENDPLAVADYKHGLGMLNDLELSYEAKKIVKYKANFKCKTGASATLTPAATSKNIFLAKHATIKLAADLASLDAASAITVNKASVKISQNLDDANAFVLGSEDPNDFANTTWDLEGMLEILWDAETYRTYMQGNTNKAVRFDLQHTANIGSASNPRLKIDFANASFAEVSRSIEMNGLVKQTVKLIGHYSSSDSKAINIVATNEVASY